MTSEHESVLDERIKGLGSLVNAQFDTVHERLNEIKEQTTKTNGGLTDAKKDIEELKLANMQHIIDCPAMPQIQAIRDNLVEYNWFKKHPVLGGTIVVVAVTLIMFNVFDVISKNTASKNLVKYNMQIDTTRLNEYQNIILSIDSLKKKYLTNNKE